jgi:hypothetical protein
MRLIIPGRNQLATKLPQLGGTLWHGSAAREEAEPVFAFKAQ